MQCKVRIPAQPSDSDDFTHFVKKLRQFVDNPSFFHLRHLVCISNPFRYGLEIALSIFALMKTPHSRPIKYRPEIRFADIDSYGIVHNANFLLYFEQSRICLFKEIAGNWDWTINGVLVARQELDYRMPVKLGDVIEITIWVQELGEKSVTCAYEAHIIKNDKRTLCTESKTVIVCYNSLTRETTKVPVEWRSAINNNGLLGRPKAL